MMDSILLGEISSFLSIKEMVKEPDLSLTLVPEMDAYIFLTREGYAFSPQSRILSHPTLPTTSLRSKFLIWSTNTLLTTTIGLSRRLSRILEFGFKSLEGRGGDEDGVSFGLDTDGLLEEAKEVLPLLDGRGIAFFILGGIITNRLCAQ